MYKLRKKKQKLQEKNRGITLIALVITIIVLLILAGVSIAMLTGENGILAQATNAREKTTKAEEEEKVQMSVMGSSISDGGLVEMIDETSFKQELQNQFGNQSLDIVTNGDGSFIVTVEETQRKYYVNDDKTVINSDNIIEISTAEELANFRDDVNSGNSYEGKAVLLTSDITLSENWTPIGLVTDDTNSANLDIQANKAFKGIFDGCNHTISNLQIDSTEGYQGLFGLVIDGTIRDITIAEDSSVKGGSRSGVVVGTLYGLSGKVYNCINNADAQFSGAGGGIVGGLIGQHTVSNCKNYGTITAQGSVGGIVGASNGYGGWATPFEQYSHKIINCGNYGSITRDNGEYCGGIVGYFNGEILNCFNKGDIQGSIRYTGGIAGNIAGSIENSYNLNDVSGQNYVAGILGVTASPIGASTTNCYSLGEISGTDEFVDEIIGGRNGLKNPEIVNCYTKNDTFTASDLGDAFKEDTGENGGYPMLYWE